MDGTFDPTLFGGNVAGGRFSDCLGDCFGAIDLLVVG